MDMEATEDMDTDMDVKLLLVNSEENQLNPTTKDKSNEEFSSTPNNPFISTIYKCEVRCHSCHFQTNRKRRSKHISNSYGYLGSKDFKNYKEQLNASLQDVHLIPRAFTLEEDEYLLELNEQH